jgi:PEP-CTERM motif
MTLKKVAAMATLPIALFGLQDRAVAVNINPTVVLPAPVVNGSVAISDAFYNVVLMGQGNENLGPMFIAGEPGLQNHGTGNIQAVFGPNPMISISENPLVTTAGNSGENSLFMDYEVEYFVPPPPPGSPPPPTSITAHVFVVDMLQLTGLSDAEATMTVSGPNGIVYTGYDCQTSGGAGAFGCRAGAGPFATNAPITMDVNAAYEVDLSLTIWAASSTTLGAGSALASIDPGFTAPSNDGGAFVYSQGLVPTPEPATWAMMLLGFTGLGFAGYRRARVAASAA